MISYILNMSQLFTNTFKNLLKYVRTCHLSDVNNSLLARYKNKTLKRAD